MIFIAILFFIYFISLFLFFLVSHPVYYCGLLVVNALLSSFITYLVFGFGWYPLLFCLVYIGGVYILFVFVSVHSPNSNYITYFNADYSIIFLLTFILVGLGGLLMYASINEEFSSFLCTSMEGNFYVFMCLTLLYGFLVLSFVMSVKINYYR